MEDFESLNFGWYQRSGRFDREFFFYIETTSIIAGRVSLQIPRSAINPRVDGFTFTNINHVSRAIRRNLIEGF